MMNEDVPDSTILLCVQRENRQLRREIEELKEGIKWRDIAIHDFKQWQKQVAEYNYLYWVRKGGRPYGKSTRRRGKEKNVGCFGKHQSPVGADRQDKAGIEGTEKRAEATRQDERGTW